MGQNISLSIFQYINDIHITLGSGFLGAFILLKNGMHSHLVKTLFFTSVTAASIRYSRKSTEKLKDSHNKIIFITGCDSGLGFSLALHSCELGFCIFAGCLNLESEGAKELIRNYPKIKLIKLDITNTKSVQKALTLVEEYIKENPEYEFWSLINNAGVMVFGEFEWQTEKLIQQQLQVNLFGTMFITKAFLPILRKFGGRVITISSHCAHATLPGLAVYGATKAGLSAWCDGLRVEQKKYGVQVVSFIPGSFIQQSNIMSRLNENVFEMQNAMTQEQREFYGDYFRQYNSYLSMLSGVRSPKKIIGQKLYEEFEGALLDTSPKSCYLYEPWRYTLYHTLFKWSPVSLRDLLIVKFVQMPEWNHEKKIQNIAHVIA